MSNTMTNVGNTMAGIQVVSQNSGISAMVQQSVNVQANLTLGSTLGAASVK
jgi:ABC-type iron transport system FetAB permease component